jgi:hydrogenase maturation factor
MTDNAPGCEVTDGCITCGDVAVALTVLSLDGADARCQDDDGRTELVALEFVAHVVPGDRVLVHAGVALERLEPAQQEG